MKLFDRNTEEVFVIGNGPSLQETPLKEIAQAGYDTFAMNRINLLYPHTTWRPDFFFMVDLNMQNKEGYWIDAILDNIGTPKYLWRWFSNYYPSLPKTIWIERCEKHHYYMADNIPKRVKSWHLPEICTAIGGLSAMLQLSVLMGYKAIYLVGCDLGYKADGQANHFVGNYTDDARDRADVDNTNMSYLHEMAKRCSPIPIYNATLGGNLEVYPRVKLEELL